MNKVYSKNGIVIEKDYNNGLVLININQPNRGLKKLIEDKFKLNKDGEIVMDIIGDEGFQDYTPDNGDMIE